MKNDKNWNTLYIYIINDDSMYISNYSHVQVEGTAHWNQKPENEPQV